MRNILLSMCLFALAIPLYAEVGFYPLGDEKVPKAIAEKAKKGVFRVIIVANPQKVDQKAFEALLDKMKSEPFTRDFLKEFYKKNPPQENNFPLFFTTSTTAFLVEHNGEQYLAMSRSDFGNHPLAELIFEYLQNSPSSEKLEERKKYFKWMLGEVQKIKVMPFIFDSEGKLIHSPIGNDTHANFVVTNFPRMLSDYYMYKGGQEKGPYLPLVKGEIDPRSQEYGVMVHATNFVFLKMAKALPKEKAIPLSWAKKPAAGAKDELVYTVGFPGLTENRVKEMRPDSDGKNMYISFGPALSAKEQNVAFFGKILDKGEKVLIPEEYLSEVLFSHKTDATIGLSGAPVLNKDGEVLGMLGLSTGINADFGNAKRVLILSSGPNALFMKKVLTEFEKIRKE